MTTLKNPKFDDFIADLRARLIARYEASSELRSEFICGEDFAAYELNTATAKPLIRRWRAGFDADAAEKGIVAVEARRNVKQAEARRAVGRLRVAGC